MMRTEGITMAASTQTRAAAPVSLVVVLLAMLAVADVLGAGLCKQAADSGRAGSDLTARAARRARRGR